MQPQGSGAEERRNVATEDLVAPGQRETQQQVPEQPQYSDEPARESGQRQVQTAPAEEPRAAAPGAERERSSETPSDRRLVEASGQGSQQAAEDRTVDDGRAEDRAGTSDLATAEQARATSEAGEEAPAQLFDRNKAEEFRSRWTELQVAFVDEPRRAVQQADELVAEVMQTLAATFAEHKRALEAQWRREGSAETEDLRLALRRYRSFFDHLLQG